jgi:hypothetical protein
MSNNLPTIKLTQFILTCKQKDKNIFLIDEMHAYNRFSERIELRNTPKNECFFNFLSEYKAN